VLVADLGSSKAEDGNVHVGFSKATLLHCNPINRGLRGCKRINAKRICAIRDINVIRG